MKLQLAILLVLISNIVKAQPTELPLPRLVLEWCLECKNTVTVAQQQNGELIKELEAERVKNAALIIKSATYQSDSIVARKNNDDLVIANEASTKIIGVQDKQIKRLKTNKWLERVLFGAVIVGTVILLKGNE